MQATGSKPYLEYPAGRHAPSVYQISYTYTLHPTPCTLHPIPYTLHPTPYTLHPIPYNLNPTPKRQQPQTLHPTPYTQKAARSTELAAMHPAYTRASE